MRNLRKLTAVVIAVALVLTSMTTAFAASTTYDFEAEAGVIKDLGIWNGDDNGDLMLGKELTRAEGAVLVLKAVLGKTDADAEDADTASLSEFVDAEEVPGWAEGWVALAVEEGVIKGTDKGELKAGDPLKGKDLASMFMNALGYADENDYGTAVECLADKSASDFVDSLIEDLTNAELTRDAAAAIVFDAFTATAADAKETLIEAIVGDDAALKAIAEEAGLIEAAPATLAVVSATASNLKEIVIKFNSALDSTKVTTTNFTVGGVASADIALSADKMSVTVIPATISTTNKADYAVKVLKAVGLAADYSATVRAFDTAIPVVTGVALTGPNTFEITFSEPIKTAGTVKVNNGIYGVTLGAVGTNKLTVNLSASSLPEGNYTINVAGFLDYAGFSVDATDVTLAYVKDTSLPVAKITGTPSQTSVVVEFNKPVTLDDTFGTGGADKYEDYFYHTFTAWRPDSVVMSADKKTFTLTFTTYPIPEGTANLVVKYIGAKADTEIKDAWGNKLASNIVLPVTVAADKTAPSITAIEVTDEQTVVIKFSESLGLTAAKAIAETVANYVVKDSADKAVATTFTATYAETPADGLYKVTLAFTSKLPGGNYTVEVKNICDGALTNNVMPTVTQTFAITDLTPINFATADDIKVTAVESASSTTADVIYVTFAEKMAATGQYSVLAANNYLLNGAALPTGTTLEAFGSTGKVVKITIADGSKQTVIGANNFTIARVADLAGNATVGLAGIESIVAEVAPVVTNVKQTDSNKVTVVVDKPLNVVLASGFKAGTSGSGIEVAAIDSWSIDSDNNTIINLTLNANSASSTTSTSALIAGFTVVADIIVSETGVKMAAADYSSLVKDYRAPKLIATSPIVEGTTDKSIEIKFTEALYNDVASLMANDLVITKADGTVLTAGLDYTTALKIGDPTVLVVTGTTGFTAQTYKVKSKDSITYIKDASAQHNNAAAFATSVDVVVN